MKTWIVTFTRSRACKLLASGIQDAMRRACSETGRSSDDIVSAVRL